MIFQLQTWEWEVISIMLDYPKFKSPIPPFWGVAHDAWVCDNQMEDRGYRRPYSTPKDLY